MKWYFNVHVLKENDFYEMKTTRSTIEIGRSTQNDLVVGEKHVSRKHLKITNENGHYFIEDLGSMNGTFLKEDMNWTRILEKKEFTPPGVIGMGHKVVLVANYYEEDDKSPKKTDGFTYLTESSKKENNKAILVVKQCETKEPNNPDDKMNIHLKERLSAITKFALFSNRANFIQNTGDGILASFSDPLNALLTSSAIMRYLERRNQNSKNPPIHVHIGLNYGKMISSPQKTEDKPSNDLKIALGIESLGREAFQEMKSEIPTGDRVLCSSSLQEELIKIEYLKEYFKFTFCGIASFKEINKKVGVFLVQDINKKQPFWNEFSPKIEPFSKN